MSPVNATATPKHRRVLGLVILYYRLDSYAGMSLFRFNGFCKQSQRLMVKDIRQTITLRQAVVIVMCLEMNGKGRAEHIQKALVKSAFLWEIHQEVRQDKHMQTAWR